MPGGIYVENAPLGLFLVVLLCVLLLAVYCTQHLAAASYRRLLERGAGAQLTQNACFLEFLLEALQGLVNRLVFLDVDNQHAIEC